MSISDKLAAIAANVPAVYAAGAAAGKRAVALESDAQIVSVLIEAYGARTALKKFAQINADSGDLTEIAGRFFTAAAKSAGGTYTSEFYRYSVNTTPLGTKLDANAGLTCTPSTIAAPGTDDYADLPLFACFDVNYTIDAGTLEPVIHAIQDVYGTFDKAPTDSMVGVMQMTGWVRRTMTDTTKKVEYRAQQSAGFEPLPEAVRASDNSVRPYVIHAKYAAGYNAVGKLSSVSGVQPATYRYGSTESTKTSHNAQITKWREWGDQYCGSSLCDIAFVQLMLEVKYATLGSAGVMTGCRNHAAIRTPAMAEMGVTRFLVSAADAALYMPGASVSLGSTTNRAQATAYDVCDIVKIANIDDVTVDGVTYKAVNLDTDATFDVTTDTYINLQPWRTGSTDGVPGNDGSPTSNASGKEPCKIQGIEVMLGMYEVPGDTTLYSDAGKYTVYTNRKAAEITSGGSGTNPVTVGTIPKAESAAWNYIAELNWGANRQEAYMLAQTSGAAPSTGYRAGLYRDAATVTGWREWRAYGYLGYSDIGGFACTALGSDLDGTDWSIGARACGSGGNRGVYSMD